MFILYSIWGFFYIILDRTHVFLENYFYIKDNPFFLRRRTFKYISYFEKLFLVLFYRKGWFDRSIANLYRKKDIVEYRRKFYPIIYSFHMNHDKVDYKVNNLKFFVKQFKFYSKVSKTKLKFNKILRVCFNKFNKSFIKFLMMQELCIMKYYNFSSYTFFKRAWTYDLLKFNRLFNIFLIRSRYKLMLFDLDRWSDWYNFNFNKKFVSYCNSEIKLTKQQQKKIKDFKLKRLFKLINVVFKYKVRVNNFNKFFFKKFKGIIYFKLNSSNFFKIRVNDQFYKLLKYYIIRFSESSITKHINRSSLNFFSFQYLRKNRIFNKGRYSRNRQLYRTGVYWCLWLNIIMVYGLYFMFYRFTFNFGYFWWGILFLAYSTIFSRIAKYNFYNINYLYKEFNNLIKWYGHIFNNMILLAESSLIRYFKNINLFNYIVKYKDTKFNFLYDNFFYYFVKFFKKLMDKRKRMKIVFLWQGMKEKDTSLFRYKTIIHWIKELYRLIIT